MCYPKERAIVFLIKFFLNMNMIGRPKSMLGLGKIGYVLLAVGLSNSWYGYLNGGVGSLSTTLNGCGVAILDFGQCCGCKPSPSTLVNLNGNEIGRTDQLTMSITINFCDGDILELKHELNGYIRFNSFTVISCS